MFFNISRTTYFEHSFMSKSHFCTFVAATEQIYSIGLRDCPLTNTRDIYLIYSTAYVEYTVYPHYLIMNKNTTIRIYITVYVECIYIHKNTTLKIYNTVFVECTYIHIIDFVHITHVAVFVTFSNIYSFSCAGCTRRKAHCFYLYCIYNVFTVHL